jgi:hypothetical protein
METATKDFVSGQEVITTIFVNVGTAKNPDLSPRNVIRETEKAYGIAEIAMFYNRSGDVDTEYRGRVKWVPKSIIKNGVIPNWFFR